MGATTTNIPCHGSWQVVSSQAQFHLPVSIRFIFKKLKIQYILFPEQDMTICTYLDWLLKLQDYFLSFR